MTYTEIKLDYANKAQSKIAELTTAIQKQIALGNEAQNELDSACELLNFHESLFCSTNRWSEKDTIYWIEHFKIKYALFDFTFIDQDIYSLPVVLPGDTPQGNYATITDLEILRTQTHNVDIELAVRIQALEEFDYSALIPQSLINDVSFAKTKVNEHDNSIASLNSQLQSIINGINQHIADNSKHLQSGEREAWNSKLSLQQLNNILSNYAQSLHQHPIADISGLSEILNSLQQQLNNLPIPENGNDGVTPRISIGTVEHGANLSISLDPASTLNNPILNFVLVKGDRGEEFKIDAVDNLERRDEHSLEESGYSFVAQDTGDIYSIGTWCLE
jgi:hypothetical protein